MDGRPRDFAGLFLFIGLASIVGGPIWLIKISNQADWANWSALFIWFVLMPAWIWFCMQLSHTRFGEYVGPWKDRSKSVPWWHR